MNTDTFVALMRIYVPSTCIYIRSTRGIPPNHLSLGVDNCTPNIKGLVDLSHLCVSCVLQVLTMRMSY